jgi:uncharacterized damage-inducible protein DinB
VESDLRYVEGMFKNNSDLVTRAIEGIPSEHWMRRPGDASNNLIWVVGHLIWARGALLRTLGSEWSRPWAKQFARGGKSDETLQYPAVEEMRNTWSESGLELATDLPKATPELLAKPHDKPTFDGTLGGYVAFMAFHETYHVGQVSYLRKWLGHGQLIG